MDLQLAGHRAVVTGSSSGLGEAIARRLSAEGAAVVVHGRRAEAVHRVVESIRAEGGEAMAALANLADAQECTGFVSAAQAAGPVDILINNAGAFANRSWEDASPEDWLELYALNVAAVVRCVQGFLPMMRANGWGRIIQIGTGEAINPFPTMPDYAATKAALLNLTVSLSKYLTRSGITVNTVSPGIVVTPGVEQFYRLEAARRGWGSGVGGHRGRCAGRDPRQPGRPARPAVGGRRSCRLRRQPARRLRQRRQPSHRRWQHRRHMTVGYKSMPWTPEGGSAHHRTGEVPAVWWQWPAGVGAVLGDDDLR